MIAANANLSVMHRRLVLAAVLSLAPGLAARAFPVLDPANDTPVPAGTELAPPDANDLRHQLQLVNGLASRSGGGWAILPRLSVQEMLTDNVLQTHSPRRWDLATYVSPGIAVIGDTPRVQLKFDYSPTVGLFARSGSQNALTQQLNGVGLITVVPELMFVDVRALAGVQSLNGGLGGVGGAGAVGTAPVTAGSFGGGNNGAGVARQDQIQTSSFAVAPYLLRRLGNYGRGKLGYSINYSRYASSTGFAASPFPTGGSNGQSQLTTEQVGQFVTGEALDTVQNTIDVSLSQSTSKTEGAGVNAFGTTSGTGQIRSTREIFTDKVTYAVSHAINVFATIGHENINYGGTTGRRINGITWNIGTTVFPNPDSQFTVSYGHQQGADSFAADGHYALTARTVISGSYANTVGTQLENLQRQLDQSRFDANGQLVNSQTGASGFGLNNALAVQPGVYRFNTLAMDLRTTLDRDLLSLALVYSVQTSIGGAATNATSSTAKTATAQWIHELRPDLTAGTSLSFSQQNFAGGTGFGGGARNTVAASAGLQYTISETLGTSLRYSYYSRDSAAPAANMYQNLLIASVTKQF